MAFALIGIGLILFMAAYQNNVAAFGSQLSADISGSSGFMVWFVALFIIGALGYVPFLRGVSRWFLVLILVVIFLGNKGFFQNFTAALGVNSGEKDDGGIKPATPATPAKPAEPVGTGG